MKLYEGGCLFEMRKVGDASVDLVYLDPPFFTQKTHKLKTRDNSEVYQFNDSWSSIHAYQRFLQQRISECAPCFKSYRQHLLALRSFRITLPAVNLG